MKKIFGSELHIQILGILFVECIELLELDHDLSIKIFINLNFKIQVFQIVKHCLCELFE